MGLNWPEEKANKVELLEIPNSLIDEFDGLSKKLESDIKYNWINFKWWKDDDEIYVKVYNDSHSTTINCSSKNKTAILNGEPLCIEWIVINNWSMNKEVLQKISGWINKQILLYKLEKVFTI